MKTTMSLHRLIAEIKAAEQELQTFNASTLISCQTGKDEDAKKQFVADANASFDKFMAASKNLVKLKAARNKANAEVQVTINGNIHTIDEALAFKAALVYTENLLNGLKYAYSANQKNGDQNNAKMEAEIQKQITTMFSGREATAEQLAVVREATEVKQKQYVVSMDGYETKVNNLQELVRKFKLEVDYSLSEANATNTVEVDLEG